MIQTRFLNIAKHNESGNDLSGLIDKLSGT